MFHVKIALFLTVSEKLFLIVRKQPTAFDTLALQTVLFLSLNKLKKNWQPCKNCHHIPDMKEKIIAIITEYQNAVGEYFKMEVPMDNDADMMEHFLECLKNEITELLKEK